MPCGTVESWAWWLMSASLTNIQEAEAGGSPKNVRETWST